MACVAGGWPWKRVGCVNHRGDFPLLRVGLLIGLIVLGIPLNEGFGQQVAVQTPSVFVSEGFSETIGTSWAVRGPNWFAQFGGAPGAVGFGPQGVYGAGAHLGFAWAKGDYSGYLWMYGYQGCVRSVIGVTPAVVLTPGWPGWVADVSISPFVMGFIPVVDWAPGIFHYPQGWSSPWWYQPYWWGPGWPYFPDLPPHRSPDSERPSPRPPSRPDYRRSFPEHRRDAFPRNPASPTGDILRSLEGKVSHAGTAARDSGRFDASSETVGERFESSGGDTIYVGEELLLFGNGFSPSGGGGVTRFEGVHRDERSSAELPVAGVAELKALRAREIQEKEREARQLWAKALAAESEGKLGVAKVYYRMVAARASSQLRDEAVRRLAELDRSGERPGERLARVADSSVLVEPRR